MKTIKVKKTKLKTSNLKIKNSVGSLKNDKSTDENDLLLLLNEADKITLNDLDFDTILNEQSKMLCNINSIVNKEGKVKGQIENKNKDNNPLCKIINSNNDSKFKTMLSNYKKQLINKNKMSKKQKTKKSLKKFKPKKTFKSINLIKHKPTSINYTKKSSPKKSSPKKSSHKKSRHKKSSHKKFSRKKTSRKKSIRKKSIRRKPCPKKNNKKYLQINKIAIKNKNIYRYNNRRKFDVTITNPQIYIKNNSKNNKLKNKQK